MARNISQKNQYMRDLRSRWRNNGCCTICGVPADVNPNTGKAYSRCFGHRLDAARSSARRYEAKGEIIRAKKKERYWRKKNEILDFKLFVWKYDYEMSRMLAYIEEMTTNKDCNKIEITRWNEKGERV